MARGRATSVEGTQSIAVSRQNVTTGAAELIEQRLGRRSALIRNRDASVSIYLGSSDSVTTSTGFEVPAEESVRIETEGAVYAIAGGTVSVDYLEEYD